MYTDFFKTFFRIGLFTLGGGYAMIPIIESEVVDKHHWIEKKDFIDIVAISQSCPGALAINMSAFIGYRLKKVPGAIVTSIATALPSFIIILLIAMFFHQFKDNTVVAAIFRGIRPAVVALIAVPTFKLHNILKLLDSYRLRTCHIYYGDFTDIDYPAFRDMRICVWKIYQTYGVKNHSNTHPNPPEGRKGEVWNMTHKG